MTGGTAIAAGGFPLALVGKGQCVNRVLLPPGDRQELWVQVCTQTTRKPPQEKAGKRISSQLGSTGEDSGDHFIFPEERQAKDPPPPPGTCILTDPAPGHELPVKNVKGNAKKVLKSW